jgi:predicted O-methyltransferase YrrM
MAWELFEQLKQQVAAGEAAAVIAPLQELRRSWPEPALATVLADALVRCGRPGEALMALHADIADGIDNHWTHYCLGHHLASRGQLQDAAAYFRRSHSLQGWTSSEERGYTFTHDYFSGHISDWQDWFERFITKAPIRILEIGSWQGGSTLWLLDHIIGPRGGRITCVDTWEGSSEHTFLNSLGLSLEELFDANIARSGKSEHVHKLKGSSHHILPELPPASFDLIYIDGAHEAQAVIQDAIHSHRLLAPGGFLLFDDLDYSFADSNQNTARAIDFFTNTFANEYHEHARSSQLLLQKRRRSDLPERLLLVLGMHRSGTSALSGLLCQQGFSPPERAVSADANNPTGYWEPPEICTFHNQLLEHLQSSWDDLILPAELWAPHELDKHLHQLEVALNHDFPSLEASQIALVKDPRQCRLQPLWNALIQKHQLDVSALLVARHPLAVARSLKRRDQLPLNRALLLWLTHTLEAERHSRHFERRVVVYELLLQNPQATLQACQDLAGLQVQHTGVDIQQWIRPDLNHESSDQHSHRNAELEADPELLRLAIEVYARLVMTHGHPISAENQLSFDQSHSELSLRLKALAEQSSRLELLQLFWEPAAGGGFSEDHSLRHSALVGKGLTRVEMIMPAGAAAARGLRLDPGEQPSVITLQELVLLRDDGDILWRWRAEDPSSTRPFSAANDQCGFLEDGQLVAASHDPGLLLHIPDSALNQIREGSRLQIEANWQPLQAQLARRLLLATSPSRREGGKSDRGQLSGL